MLAGPGGAIGVAQPVVVAVEVHRAGLRPQLSAGGNELLGAFVAGLVGAFLAHPLEVVLNSARHDVDVYAPVGNLVQGGGHLREQAQGNEAGAHGDEEPDAAGDCREGRGGGPGLGEWRVLGK